MFAKRERDSLRGTKFGQLTVGKLMESQVQSGHKNTKAEMLASFMMDGFGSVPIVDDSEKLVGIVSEFDLLNALRIGKTLNDVTAGKSCPPIQCQLHKVPMSLRSLMSFKTTTSFGFLWSIRLES